MKALLALKSAIDQTQVFGILILLSLIPVLAPEISLAESLQTSQETSSALVFQINDQNKTSTSTSQTYKSIDFQTVVASDPLAKNLKEFLEANNSPLADISDKLITYKHWERALAISYVESHMCMYTPKKRTANGYIESHNCSGIGGDSYRMYDSYEGWFADMTKLLDQPNYVNRPIEKFLRYYVQPGSMNWLNGVRKKEAQLAEIKIRSEQEKAQMAQVNTIPVSIASQNTQLVRFELK